ncbi:MAG: hypothetical protein APF82_00115 [Sphingomonadales bacterium BRH_c42]|nr:MAG: hypothetical protein APF82_00115 [Sphingomonadales bacterium BRH_c42]
MEFLHQLIFASEADLVVLSGAGLVLVAFAALAADRRRLKRKHIDRVGWVPWTGLFLLAFVAGIGLIALALPQALGG